MEHGEQWLEDLFKINAPKLYKLAYKRLHNRELAEDLVQEVFLVAVTKRTNLASHNAPELWLFKALFYRIGNELQLQAHRRTVPLDDISSLGVQDPERTTLDDIFPEGLNAKDQTLLRLFYNDERSYKEISEYFGVSIENCRTMMCRARMRFQKLYMEQNS